MGEYFELTFFLHKDREKKEKSKKELLDLLNLKEGKNKMAKHQYPLFVGREIVFLGFDCDHLDFIQCSVSLGDFIFTQKNFEEKIIQLLEVVDVCFSHVKTISFATGIYEMTCHYIQQISNIKDFDASILSKFPILFFKKGYEQGFNPSFFRNDVSCVVNIADNVQELFTTPIGELMEDDGLSFDEAHIKHYGYGFPKDDFVEEYAKRFGMSLEAARKALSSQG